MVELETLLKLKKDIEKAISESIAIPTAKPATPKPVTPKPLKEATKK